MVGNEGKDLKEVITLCQYLSTLVTDHDHLNCLEKFSFLASAPIRIFFFFCIDGKPIVATGKWYQMSRIVEDFHVLSFNVLLNLAASLAVGMLQ